MESFHESKQEYKNQLKKGIVQKAYRGLMDYFGSLRVHFGKKYPDYPHQGTFILDTWI